MHNVLIISLKIKNVIITPVLLDKIKYKMSDNARKPFPPDSEENQGDGEESES
jgi:hypothetical protein